MLRISMTLLLCSLVATALPASSSARSWHSDDTAALVGGLLLGGIAASAASHDHVHQNQYIPPPPPYPPRSAPFSPARDVICYPRQGACFNPDGDFLPTWTNRLF
ncbi:MULTISPECIES: hypothetical protein [unclassified Rhizobium]|uniref:hypothetical protein n=1 Tax=unclassified Rhizobium TaxID=2613769 RepID=UPI00161003BE|nr:MULTISPECIES: hypothetical protein [unclassified Rhizobium]MBB3316552.1 hypothetical protein [Rhizobium sp. BK181]MBB3542642.1 hypothetical protein [Rhizobium sp. BK399]MCS3739441.1 hypothetical protein [Rhizobium sp. BK661]MCS4091352.1 hypothetical protein [Rhizobium sp. BK176]